MQPTFRKALGAMLPDELVLPYIAEREAAWLLCQRLDGPARIATLRRGPLAPLLLRPGVREVTAHCGDGWLAPHQLLPLADPLYAFGRERELMVDRASEKAFDIACAADWRQFTVSFSAWAEGIYDRGSWRELQVSRPGGNLVLQLNFPESYRAEFERIFGPELRTRLQCFGHPVRESGPITMAWARLDLDPWGEELLIEELQSDWLRMIGVRALPAAMPTRAARKEARLFCERSIARCGRGWGRILMFAVLVFATRELGAQRIWMHQPRTGARLKNIREVLPPRSLYTDLPKKFGFAQTDRAPDFLYTARPQVLSRLRRAGAPLFWCLDLSQGSARRVD